MEKLKLHSLKHESAYDRTYFLPDLEPLARERRKRSGKTIISAGMDAAVLERIRSSSSEPVSLDHIHRMATSLRSEGLKHSTIRTYIYYCKASLRLGLGIAWARSEFYGSGS